ncbi:phosphoribosylaminoimidazolesuccinocarboxamide synthase [Viridibacillus sp. FSL R5-0477]|uniref:Phosphoribosylaminoimidazole-succinocarboxamide synthase n=1 Tax=Viridibacillus arenosi FSL R5-213 TaxID=1227360 RepID=W4EMT2_9BACL|nr:MULTISPECIES: phosphoribosylaminoimidazolesuccinocarboxamide synthase [Viridibacillus]ETT81091.1 phosphoribosylaminoimidazole-succinocarboxamide synthase [Viridibacillus arenosi FSL R5-213]OMC84045.1 phosphoribosylaminoimidazolesuccinocarboxamide synthase [Viridibacillus sp. FSL H8-0123]OMC88567.1 phosphoribosylaminoimidazolesuccinocarboxamide synthase [Viridibacillus sp. FSL H7-0596]OMC93200.1 phosphoribosylaminoimidazolesuccinocarboxamide synthase [Viridibacillus arenosi]
MELKYQGKTKDVYQLEDGPLLLKFKDDVTGENGVFDPGANTVGLTIDGAGRAGLSLTTFFYKKLNAIEVPTHFISSDIENATMTVKPATVFGKGLEVICRFRAVGSFLRRYGAYVEEGQKLESFVEVTIKDDDRLDPPISADALAELQILSLEEYETLKQRTVEISNFVKAELAKKGLELYDIKLEFGRDAKTGEILLIDEISGGNMRAYKGSDYIEPLELEKIMLSK